ncbi:MAG: hypothetical protein WC953_03985 [Pseudomonas sp.]
MATAEDGERLFRAGILYAPDYVINAGGLIHGALNDSAATRARIGVIGERLSTIFATSAQEGKAPQEVADSLARAILKVKSQGTRHKGDTL